MDAATTNLTHGSPTGPVAASVLGYTASMSISWPTTSVLAALLVGWVFLCASLRFRRIDNLQKRLGYTDRASLARMTNNDAQVILQNIIEFEFPKLYLLSLQFAIFKARALCCDVRIQHLSTDFES